jgi:hypothetical protein
VNYLGAAVAFAFGFGLGFSGFGDSLAAFAAFIAVAFGLAAFIAFIAFIATTFLAGAEAEGLRRRLASRSRTGTPPTSSFCLILSTQFEH